MQIVVATLSGADSHRVKDMRFKVVIVDEASQATEPATAVPLVRSFELLLLLLLLLLLPSAARRC